ncbi:MAG: efflux RND transporter periplasmic adaptor subunit [Verrucomicrobiota bacterium]
MSQKNPPPFLAKFRDPKVFLPVAGLTLLVAWLLSRAGSDSSARPSQNYFTAEKSPFTITIPAGGSLTAVEEVTVRNEVEGTNQIIRLVDEGEYVSEGDLLVELDASKLATEISEAEIAYQNSLSKISDAEEKFEVVKSDNEIRLRDAELAFELAQKDLEKYTYGAWPQNRKNAESAIALAREELNRAQDRLAWTRKLEEKGYATQSEFQADQLAVKRKQIDLEKAQENLRLLTQFDHPRQQRQMEANVANTRTRLERFRRQAELQSDNAGNQLTAARETALLREARLEELREQMGKTEIFAPRDGLVVYARNRHNQVRVEEGAYVREREELLLLPDISQMKVEVDIYENQISLVERGMLAEVHLDSLPDRSFRGEVLTIAAIPEPARWGNPNYRVYKAEVVVTDQLPAIKPGVTARVDIVVAELEDVIKIPLQAVVGAEDRQFCFVQAEGKETLVEVEIGLFDNEFVEIRSGLQQGDRIVLTPPSQLELPTPEENVDEKEGDLQLTEAQETLAAAG